jgi:hypothetical protein
MGAFVTKLILHYCIAFGVVLGASMLSGISAVLTLQPPGTTMKGISENIKIWAVVAAIGGTIDPIRALETNIMFGHINPAIKQILLIASAFLGAYSGTKLIQWICSGEPRL